MIQATPAPAPPACMTTAACRTPVWLRGPGATTPTRAAASDRFSAVRRGEPRLAPRRRRVDVLGAAAAKGGAETRPLTARGRAAIPRGHDQPPPIERTWPRSARLARIAPHLLLRRLPRPRAHGLPRPAGHQRG